MSLFEYKSAASLYKTAQKKEPKITPKIVKEFVKKQSNEQINNESKEENKKIIPITGPIGHFYRLSNVLQTKLWLLIYS